MPSGQGHEEGEAGGKGAGTEIYRQGGGARLESSLDLSGVLPVCTCSSHEPALGIFIIHQPGVWVDKQNINLGICWKETFQIENP